MFTASVFTISRMWEQPKYPSTEMDGVYIYNGILDIKKNEIMLLEAMCMDLETIILSEVSHTEKDKYYMI